MNEPLREAITKKIYEAMQVSYLSERHDAIKQLFITTLTDLQAEMPTKITKCSISCDFGKGCREIIAHNKLIQQQQAAFKKVLEGMK